MNIRRSEWIWVTDDAVAWPAAGPSAACRLDHVVEGVGNSSCGLGWYRPGGILPASFIRHRTVFAEDPTGRRGAVRLDSRWCARHIDRSRGVMPCTAAQSDRTPRRTELADPAIRRAASPDPQHP